MLAYAILACHLWSALPDTGWTKVRDQGSQRLDVAPVAGSPVEAFRTSGTDSVPFAQVGETLLDIPGMVRWIPYLAESKILRTAGPGHFVVYHRYGLPWPFADRDIVVDVRIRRVPEKALVECSMTGIVDSSRALEPGTVRLSDMDGTISLQALGSGGVRASYAERIDLGGSIPARLARTFSREIPTRVMDNLRKECRTPARVRAGAASPWNAWVDSLHREGVLE